MGDGSASMKADARTVQARLADLVETANRAAKRQVLQAFAQTDRAAS
ncbi:MAG: hypothetical protein ACFB22_05375 [Rhodothalassiaceae bacterium]